MTSGEQWYRRNYLRSLHWYEVRRRALADAGGRCSNWWCRRRAVEVHHLHYGSIGEEQPGDVRALCRCCHRLAHRRWLAAAWWWVWDFRRR